MIKHSPDNNSILVMGVGRSGTTAIYGLLQQMLEGEFPGEVDYVYEPFLWDRKTFNKPYAGLTQEFEYAASLSIEGIYHHKRIPMLLGDDSVIDPPSTDWLKETLTQRHGKRHYLGKMIRANGRIRLIRELAPETKIIFIIRNPIDVLNSATQLFSLYGREFYESDFGRFSDEVEARFGTRFDCGSPELSAVKAEYAYWYFSNRAFLEYAKRNPSNILSVSHEAFVENRESVIGRICEFTGLEFNQELAQAAGKPIGPVRQNHASLSKKEYSFLHAKMDAYKGLLKLVDFNPSGPVEQNVKRTQWIENDSARQNLPCFNGWHAGMRLREMELHLAQLETALAQTKSELADLLASRRYRFISWLLAPLDKLKRYRTP